MLVSFVNVSRNINRLVKVYVNKVDSELIADFFHHYNESERSTFPPNISNSLRERL